MNYRDTERARMLYKTERDPHTGQALCHYCGKRKGCQMHELVNRAQTVGNSQARELSFTATLCSYLCPNCHEKHAPTQAGEQKLWQRNFEVWGKDVVLADLWRLEQALGHIPLVNLP